MGRRKMAGNALLLLGIIILVVSLLADPLGIGGSAGFGTRQIAGTIAGAIVAAAGLFLRLRR